MGKPGRPRKVAVQDNGTDSEVLGRLLSGKINKNEKQIQKDKERIMNHVELFLRCGHTGPLTFYFTNGKLGDSPKISLPETKLHMDYFDDKILKALRGVGK